MGQLVQQHGVEDGVRGSRSAFAANARGGVELLPCHPPAPFSPALHATAGLRGVWARIQSNTAASPSGVGDGAATGRLPQSWSLPDGRLNIGTHLPLLAKRYRFMSLLGEGASAQVVLAADTLRGKLPVCIKIMKRQYAYAGHKEVRALRHLHSWVPGGGAGTHIVQLLGSFTFAGHCCLVLERLFPSLLDHIVASAQLPAVQALRHLRKVAHQLMVAAALLHRCGLVHADLKPDNVLMAHPGEGRLGVKVVDFGSCFCIDALDTGRLTFELQTLPYRAPEVLQGEAFGSGVDVWSLGCILAEMALHRPLFPCHTPGELLQQMAAALGPLPDAQQQATQGTPSMPLRPTPHPPTSASNTRSATRAGEGRALGGFGGRVCGWSEAMPPLQRELMRVHPALADLVMRMLTYAPAQRITAQEALRHHFFDALIPLRCLEQPPPQQPPASLAHTLPQLQGHSSFHQQQQQQQRLLSPKPHMAGLTIHTVVPIALSARKAEQQGTEQNVTAGSGSSAPSAASRLSSRLEAGSRREAVAAATDSGAFTPTFQAPWNELIAPHVTAAGPLQQRMATQAVMPESSRGPPSTLLREHQQQKPGAEAAVFGGAKQRQVAEMPPPPPAVTPATKPPSARRQAGLMPPPAPVLTTPLMTPRTNRAWEGVADLISQLTPTPLTAAKQSDDSRQEAQKQLQDGTNSPAATVPCAAFAGDEASEAEGDSGDMAANAADTQPPHTGAHADPWMSLSQGEGAKPAGQQQRQRGQPLRQAPAAVAVTAGGVAAGRARRGDGSGSDVPAAAAARQPKPASRTDAAATSGSPAARTPCREGPEVAANAAPTSPTADIAQLLLKMRGGGQPQEKRPGSANPKDEVVRFTSPKKEKGMGSASPKPERPAKLQRLTGAAAASHAAKLQARAPRGEGSPADEKKPLVAALRPAAAAARTPAGSQREAGRQQPQMGTAKTSGSAKRAAAKQLLPAESAAEPATRSDTSVKAARRKVMPDAADAGDAAGASSSSRKEKNNGAGKEPQAKRAARQRRSDGKPWWMV